MKTQLDAQTIPLPPPTVCTPRGALRPKPNRRLLWLLGAGLLAAPLSPREALAGTPSFPDGFITARVYLNCGPGDSVSDLLADPLFPDSPDMVVYEPCFELWATGDGTLPAPDPSGVWSTTTYTNYGAQMLGYFFPPANGNYAFYICSDDNSELFLSTDDNPANKLLIAAETAWSDLRQYTTSLGGSDLTAKRSDQFAGSQWPTKNTITLIGGKAYYIEALMKQGGGGDNLSVSIDGVNPIGGIGYIGGRPNLLSSFQGEVELQPQNVANINNNDPWSITVVGGVTNIVAGGLDVWHAENASGNCVPLDGFVFDYIPITGDFDYRLRVLSMTDPSPSGWSKCGLMARENLTPGSPHVFCLVTPPPPGNGFYNAQGRDLPGTWSWSDANDQPVAPYPNAWLRLRREGPVFKYYWGTNGYTWQQFSVHDTSTNGSAAGFPQTLLLGIATSAHNDDAPVPGATVTAQVSDFGEIFTIAQQPAPQDVPLGGTAVFSVTVTNVHLEDVRYQWLFNGAPIPGATSNQLVIANVTADYDGLYSARITYAPAGDTNTTAVASLTVLSQTAGWPKGVITAQVFLGNGVSDYVAYLLTDPNFPNSPDMTFDEPYFELWATGQIGTPPPSSSGYVNYGARLFGYFYPPATGNYTFYLCSDDNSELFLSTDATPDNKRLIAAETSWSAARQYTSSYGGSDLTAKRSDQFAGTQWPTGNTIRLVQGNAYYIEALMKQSGGGDNLSVSVDGNLPIDGSLLSRVTIAQEPVPQQVPIGGTAEFSVTVTNVLPGDVQYQWLFNGAPIPGATNSRLVITNASTSNDGLYSVAISSAASGPIGASAAARLEVSQFVVNVYTAIELRFPTSVGANYQIQASTDLLNWADVGSPIPGTGQYVSVFESTRSSSYRYYRAKTL